MGWGELVSEIVVGDARVVFGDCRDVLKTLADCSVDSVVTDPPYELGFMGKKWDSSGIAYDVSVWEECLRVLKPGGHVLAFGGSRTWYRLAVAIEDAGFEIGDSIAWMYGSGFPKSLDVSKAIDKTAGHWRGKSAGVVSGNNSMVGGNYERTPKGEPITPEAQEWKGWGTALKPAFEPIFVGRKPFAKGSTVAANVLLWGVGGLNIDASRIGTTVETWPSSRTWTSKEMSRPGGSKADDAVVQKTGDVPQGRWPANVILDEYSAGLLDEQSGENPSRFFYCAKASKRDRNEGLDGLENRVGEHGNKWTDQDYRRGDDAPTTARKNFHPTVKPTALMRYLIKLVTPAGGTVLDPFTGSGSTGKAALLDGYKFVGAELTEEYLPIIEGRLRWAYEREADDETLF